MNKYKPGAGKIRQNMPDLRLFDISGEQSGRRNPHLLFWGCIGQRKGSFWSFWVPNLVSWVFRAYRQVHWCAALFCSTTPEQTKIPKSRLNSRVSDGLGESLSGRNPPPHAYFEARESKEKGNFWRKASIGRYTGVQHCSAGPAQSRQKYPKNRPKVRVFDFTGQNPGRRNPPPPYFGTIETKKIGHSPRKTSLC